jgi:prefoldin subunit 5
MTRPGLTAEIERLKQEISELTERIEKLEQNELENAKKFNFFITSFASGGGKRIKINI